MAKGGIDIKSPMIGSAINTGSLTSSKTTEYIGNRRNRCIQKKLPGCDPIYYVYDGADHLIFTQDGEQSKKTPKEWTFSIPDVLGRVVFTFPLITTTNIHFWEWRKF